MATNALDKITYEQINNMTVQEILDLKPNQISKLGKRELSRAVRTVALAANKRLNRLKEQAKKSPKTSEQKGAYIPKKSASHKIALDALNWATKDGKSKGTFGVGDKSFNQLRAEMSRMSQFMGMKTSTIKGAKEVRKGREERILGTSLEAYEKAAKKEYIKAVKKNTGKRPTKAMIDTMMKAQAETFISQTSNAWALYRKFVEMEGLPTDKNFRYYGSDNLIAMAGSLTLDGTSEGEALNKLHEEYEQYYKEQQDANTKAIEDMYEEDGEEPLEFDM